MGIRGQETGEIVHEFVLIATFACQLVITSNLEIFVQEFLQDFYAKFSY